MDPKRFSGSSAGRTIRVGQGEAAYWAFVPNPLPPELAFDMALACTLSEADRALGELAGLARSVPNPNLLVRPFIRREAVLSSRIEGTQTDIADLYAYEAGQRSLPGLKPPPPESDVREVLNYVHAMEYGLERLGTLPVSLRLIREVHGRLMEGVRGGRATPGEFRRSPNWIGRPGCTPSTAEFVPPPVEEMHQALDAFEKYLHRSGDYPPLMRLAFLHYQFEAIHPFLDGNGRVGRLLMTLLLVEWGLLPLPLLYLSAFFEHHRDDYYRHLLAVSERGAWDEWVAFFLQGVATQARDAIGRAKRLQELQIEWREKLTKERASASALRLADGLFVSPVITIPQAQRILGMSYPGAQANVARLVSAGILRHEGEGYGKTFAANDIFTVLDPGADDRGRSILLPENP